MLHNLKGIIKSNKIKKTLPMIRITERNGYFNKMAVDQLNLFDHDFFSIFTACEIEENCSSPNLYISFYRNLKEVKDKDSAIMIKNYKQQSSSIYFCATAIEDKYKAAYTIDYENPIEQDNYFYYALTKKT